MWNKAPDGRTWPGLGAVEEGRRLRAIAGLKRESRGRGAHGGDQGCTAARSADGIVCGWPTLHAVPLRVIVYLLESSRLPCDCLPRSSNMFVHNQRTCVYDAFEASALRVFELQRARGVRTVRRHVLCKMASSPLFVPWLLYVFIGILCLDVLPNNAARPPNPRSEGLLSGGLEMT
jgi:hypothetical protein